MMKNQVLQHEHGKHHKIHVLIVLISIVIMLLSISVYIGSLLGIAQITSISSTWINMKINTALCFFLAGFALLLVTSKHRGIWGSYITASLATLILVISGITIIEYLTGVDLNIDQLIMNDNSNLYPAIIYPYPGRMALSTAVNFVLIALSFFFLLRQSLSIWLMQTFIWVILTITSTAFFLYFFQTNANSILAIYSMMSMQTILLFFLLSTGLLLINPESGIVGIFLRNNITGYLMRRVIVIPIIFPIVLIQVVFYFHGTGAIDYATAMVAIQMGIFALTGLVIAISSRILDRKEIELKETQSQVARIQTKATQKIQDITQHDLLTGLLSRPALEKDIDNLIANDKSKSIAIMVFDIDRFKFITASLGHQRGDHLLKMVVTRVSNLLKPEQARFARFAADKFILYIPVSDRQTAPDFAQMIHRGFKDMFALDDHQVRLSISIGIAIYPKDGLDSSSLILNADLAMYDAKERGGNRTNFFSKALPLIASKKIAMDMDLRQALIDSTQFTLEYQPQINLKTGRICATEILVRWEHPAKGLIYPSEFIPFAEKNNLIVPLNELIMRKSFEQISSLELDIPVSINISAQQLEDGFHLVDYINLLMNKFKKNAKQIELEITENMLVEDTEHNLAVLTALHELGFQIAIDDFGTGFSSFNYLQRLPVHKIKIDKSFIAGLPTNSANVKIVKAIIVLAHSLNMIVVAEGAETEAEVEFLKQEHCDMVQGFYYYKPMSLDDLRARIKYRNLPGTTF